MTTKNLILGVSVIGGFGGLMWYINQLNLIKLICIKANGYKVKKISAKETIIRLDLLLKNKGSFEVLLTRYSFNVYGNDKKLASLYSTEKLTILPNSENELSMDLVFTPKNLLQNIGNVLTGTSWENIVLKIKGNVFCKKKKIPFIVPIDYDFTLKSTLEPSTQSC